MKILTTYLIQILILIYNKINSNLKDQNLRLLRNINLNAICGVQLPCLINQKFCKQSQVHLVSIWVVKLVNQHLKLVKHQVLQNTQLITSLFTVKKKLNFLYHKDNKKKKILPQPLLITIYRIISLNLLSIVWVRLRGAIFT